MRTISESDASALADLVLRARDRTPWVLPPAAADALYERLTEQAPPEHGSHGVANPNFNAASMRGV